MPNVVVYVPAKAWKALEERGLDPAKVVREFAKKGYEVSEGQLPERGVSPAGGDGVTAGGESEARRAGPSSLAAPNPSPASRSGSCPMSPPRGTKCKVCGKVHPL